ncbi:hypothetical protein QWY85_12700 [Neolewinella lacunae]|uniref:Uncharacterized protein n=1 Tax=Neolewinella lacunae TaxID=1517758 RepID=A0A923PLR7_9BACT|nr:hypothetical protein [Neolewinella lacunae]MBC6993619.1 hypothetical protein [Neolewinella lacunae]MDN3635525.1 hypothetical protein [Neolewinella lacunae]
MDRQAGRRAGTWRQGLVLLGMAGLLLLIASRCAERPAPPPHPGAALAESYCGNCHLVPDPGDLPVHIWKD